MQSALFFMIVYVICTVNSEINKTEDEKLNNEESEQLAPLIVDAEEAIEILEKSNKTHPIESVQLIAELKRLMDTYNLRELVIDLNKHNNTKVDTKHSVRTRDNILNIDGFAMLKKAIVTHPAFNMTTPKV
ncbi:hypothetical protein B5X24_HaOG213609 [Helicoverpa armigera]|uniref:Uncharacterized protein n=1 Tax=Helicoverpa armigera TaxID=29058 RepID=A0A2W1B6V6_HELAM|nr:hypothetical protein B5X24_HaOG213609 [Helicoverpa armigera]